MDGKSKLLNKYCTDEDALPEDRRREGKESFCLPEVGVDEDAEDCGASDENESDTEEDIEIHDCDADEGRVCDDTKGIDKAMTEGTFDNIEILKLHVTASETVADTVGIFTEGTGNRAVSYTHLTLPTILLV